MVIIENAIFTEVKPSLLPNTILLDVKSFPDGNNFVKIVLVLTRGGEKWSIPFYLLIVGIPRKGTIRWALSPWITDAAVNNIATLVPPSLLFSRISPADEAMLVQKSNDLWPEVAK